MPLTPHHDGSALYVSNSSPELGDRIRVRLRVPAGYGPIRSVHVRSNPDQEPEWAFARALGITGGWEWWEAELTVRNPTLRYRWLVVHENGRTDWINQAGIDTIETRDADDFVIAASAGAPDWLTSSVMYQIFPDRFGRSAGADAHETPEWAIPAAWDEPVDTVMPARSQQFYGGDLDGVVEHLDHLSDLGVGIIYLTPFFAGRSNHRYDASDFDAVDPLLGGDEALVRLVEAAHARGIKVMGDLTSNHSGSGHAWFKAALGAPEAPEGELYYFTDPEHTEYVGWFGIPTLPKFDWSSEELASRFLDGPDAVVQRWLRPPFSLDGWRIDVANMTGRLADVDHNAAVRTRMRAAMTAVNPDTALLAEITNDATADLQGDAWHGAMTYPSFTRPLWGWLGDDTDVEYVDADGEERQDPWFFGQPLGGLPRYTAEDFIAQVNRFTAGIPWRVRLGNMQPLDTHDTGRFATQAAAGVVPVAVGLSMTMPGVPVVFAGDEFGLDGVDGEHSRTPMPWGSEHLPGRAERLALYRELIALRAAHPALSVGGMRWIASSPLGFAFVRETAAETLLVVASRGSVALEIPTAAVESLGEAKRLFGSATITAQGARALISDKDASFTVWQLPGVRVPGGAAWS